jgi:hypothetical protein
MHDPRKALYEWWQLVKPGGHLIFIVPDEDLYEQGVFPSRFNGDHKATFTISKLRSWSPVSYNVLDLARSLPKGELVSLHLQDIGYERSRLIHGPCQPRFPVTFLFRVYRSLRRRLSLHLPFMEELLGHYEILDQTMTPDGLAQIQCIVKKLA